MKKFEVEATVRCVLYSDVEKIELFRLTVNRASELEKEMQDQFDWGITK